MAGEPGSVEDYISSFPPPVREILRQIRTTVRDAVPGSGETISYKIAAVTLDGATILHYAGWKAHVSLYPAPAGDEDFERQAGPFRSSKSTLKFPVRDAIPYDLVAQVARMQAERHQANPPPGQRPSAAGRFVVLLTVTIVG